MGAGHEMGGAGHEMGGAGHEMGGAGWTEGEPYNKGEKNGLMKIHSYK